MFLITDYNLCGMAAHSARNGGDNSADLPDAIPFNLPHLTRLSWELGSRIVEGKESTLHSKWERTDMMWTLSIFRVTSNTVLLCVCTPVGRERFYGTAETDLESGFPKLAAAPYWKQLD